MKLQEAKQLIKKTFENPFSRDRFTLFVNNLLKDAYEEKTFIQTGAHLPDAFAAYIRKMERIGKYEDIDGNIIDILLVELKKERSIEWARTTQRNFIRRYLNGSRGGELKDAAIVAFYTERAEDWRFSLIKMQYSLEKKKDDLTPAKRFSFLVGKNEKSHTAQNQLTDLLTMEIVPTLADIEMAFNIETVTREFFEKYKELFLRVKDFFEKQFEKNQDLRNEMQAKHIDHISFAKKLLGQIVFLYFLQKKGWLGVAKDGKWGEGDKKFLRSLVDKAIQSKLNFYTDYLENLFYEALAEERRNAADPSYYRLLDCKIPFLNGGLFEADYDWKNIAVKIPNDCFTNENITKEGDRGDGILDVFDRYNFTVKEDEPLEKEVAVDPEMLGKVFENLLEVTDRKSKGAFYTPREIVHYMCQESLINYLNTNLNSNPGAYQKLGTDQSDMFGNKSRTGQLPLEVEQGKLIRVERKDIEIFIREGAAAINNDARVEKVGKETERYSYQLPETIRYYAIAIDKALADIRVCDPAIGSGAFPVGIMNEIVKAREILTTYLLANSQKERTPYEFKRHCIQECIYGVDIDHSAIDIAKLRLWLSLVVDEEDFYNIKPLPNLDYKIVEANSLIGLPDGIVKNDEAEKEMEKLKNEFFNETNSSRKIQLRKKINTTIEKLLTTANEFLPYKIDFDLKLCFSEVFHEKGGFDLFIGNPPYLEARSSEFTDELKENLQNAVLGRWKEHSKFITRGSDLLIYFLELGIYYIHRKGEVVYITQNSWLDTEFGKKFQNFLLNQTNVKAIIDNDFKYFDGRHGPNINTVISVFQGKVASPQNKILFSRFHENFESTPTNFLELSLEKQKIFVTSKSYTYQDKILSEIKWGILLSATDKVLNLIKKINSIGKYIEKLNSLNLSIGQGLNISKDYFINENNIKDFPFLKKGLLPFFTNDDGAPFEILKTKNYLVNSSKFSTQELKEIKKKGFSFLDSVSNNKKKPSLILPRGIGRHFCALNKCSAFSSSFVDLYDNIGNLSEERKLNLWLFLNSSVCWLIREISGRKNLGGGMLKAEAIDLKSFPIYFDFNQASRIKAVYEKLCKREAVDSLSEIDSKEHKEIDDIVFGHLSISETESLRLKEELYNLIYERNKKSKT